MKILLSIVLAVLVAGASSASGLCASCKIKNIGVGPYYDSICTTGGNPCVFVAVDQTVVNKATCATNSYWNFALDISTTSGKATYAFLLAAFNSGQSVNIGGTNDCNLSSAGAVETLYYAAFPT